MLSPLVMFNLIVAERQPVVAVQVSRQITSIDTRRVFLPDMSAKRDVLQDYHDGVRSPVDTRISTDSPQGYALHPRN